VRSIVFRLAVVLLVCAVACAGAAAQSFSLVYDFAGLAGNQASTPVRASSLIANLAASNLVRGPGVSAASGSGSFAASGFSTGGWNGDDWFGWSLGPASGHSMTLTELVIPERRSASGIRAFSLRSSRDNFASDIFSATVPDDTLVRRHSVSLGTAFAGIDTAVEFRLYGYQAESGSGTWRLGTSSTTSENPDLILPELIVAGRLEANAVSAPEPSAWALTLLGMGVLAVRLRAGCARRGWLV
jgi:hypothetical protein